MTDFLTALALVLVIEGIALALFPDRVRSVLQRLDELASDQLRLGGLVAVVIGVICVWLLRG
jgi:uncharacterized protein YjeT (DUF2065 family)